MGIGVDHIHMKAREEAMRANALEGRKNVVPDKARDRRFLFITLGVLAAVVGVLLLPMILSLFLEWLL